jgi:hypothetical protein
MTLTNKTMEFKKNAKIATSDFYYDLFDGGYISPKKLLKNKEDIERVVAAIEIIKAFKDAAESSDIIEYN